MKAKYFNRYFSMAIKVILILSIISAINNRLWHIMSTNLFLLILIFIPQIFKNYGIKIPRVFEWFLFVFVISTFFLGKIGGVIVPLFFGIAIALIGFMILALLYSSNQIKKNHLLIISFTFSFTVAFGFILELLKYYLKIIFGSEIKEGIYETAMRNMSLVIAGAIIASVIGYVYMNSKSGILRKIFGKIAEKNPGLFLRKNDLLEEVIKLIKKGESENLEFKSTLRTNLHTKEIDKKIEISSLKTISAFLNSKGGVLIIGVNDKREILGIERDNFENTDKFTLHLTNLIKEKIGQKFLHLIKIQSVLIEGKTIILVDCGKSKLPVFLKLASNEEEFYIRSGPASIQAKASELVEYVKGRFE